MLAGLSTLRVTVLVVSVIFLLAGLAIAYFLGKNISTPVTHLANECKIMSGGDFSRAMHEKYTKRRDEIGDLARSFDNIKCQRLKNNPQCGRRSSQRRRSYRKCQRKYGSADFRNKPDVRDHKQTVTQDGREFLLPQKK